MPPRIRATLHGVQAVLNAGSDYVGRVAAWLVLLMMLITVWDVGMRYVFHSGSIRLQELQWHLFALIFLLGAAHTQHHNAHVRLDLVYHSRWFSDRHRALLDVLGTICFLIPFCLLVIFSSTEFVYQAMLHGEGSPDPGGLPQRWLIKAAIPAGFVLLLLQGVADLLARLLQLTGKQE